VIVAALAPEAPDAAVAHTMLAAAPHRGRSVTTRVHGRCVLGAGTHPDLPEGSLSGPGDLTAAFTGRLDNAAEVAAAVTRAGFPAASPTPADLAVSAFRVFGEHAPDRLRGTFAGVVTDGARMWCFRDHLGFRPLFFRDDRRAFLVASEPKQILAGASLAREPDLAVLEQLFYGRVAGDAGCALRGVSRLPQAHILTTDGRRPPRTAAYWHPARTVDTLRLSPADADDRLCELLDQAVARSLRGHDVISLSGGIDSSAIAAFAAPRGRLAALSAVYPDFPAVDERRYIEVTAQQCDLELHTYVQQARALDDATHWCAALDGPVPMVSIPELHENYALARRLGFRNVLTGELAEFVLGSPRYLLGHLLTHFRWGALARLVGAERHRGRAWSTLGRQLVAACIPGRLAAWYARRSSRDAPRRVPDWLDPGYVTAGGEAVELRTPARRRWSAEQVRMFGGATVALDADEACAARSGVTVRRPFADVDLWEFFLSLAPETKFPDLGSKTLVRRVLRGRIPDAVLERRRKTVFDDHFMAQIDYATLRRLLAHPATHRVTGVDYGRLALRLEREDFSIFDWFWAKDLAIIHAFLEQW